MRKLNAKELTNYLILYLIYPFIAFLVALRNFGNRNARAVILLFIVFIGVTFMPTQGADGWANYQKFLEYSGISFGEFIESFILSLTGQGPRGFENYHLVTSFFISQISTDFFLIYGFWALLFGVVYISLIGKLYDQYQFNSKSNYNALFFLIAFALFVSVITTLNGRFWFGYWVLMLALYKIFVDRDNRFMILAFATTFIHQSLLLGALLILLFTLTNKVGDKRNIFLYIGIGLGYIYSFTPIEYFREALGFIGGGFEERGMRYFGEEQIARREYQVESRPSWFLLWYKWFLFHTVAISLLYVNFYYSKLFDNPTKKLYSFFLLFWILILLVSEIPTLGSRFFTIQIGVGLLTLFLIFKNPKFKSLSLPFYINLPAFIFYFIIEYRKSAEFIYDYLFFSNPFIVPFLPGEDGLWEFLSSFI